jgi:hypothetical protein
MKKVQVQENGFLASATTTGGVIATAGEQGEGVSEQSGRLAVCWVSRSSRAGDLLGERKGPRGAGRAGAGGAATHWVTKEAPRAGAPALLGDLQIELGEQDQLSRCRPAAAKRIRPTTTR